MPRGKLTEDFVKENAVRWLEDHYRNREDTQSIVSGLEAWVSKKSPLGYGRADGLIAIKRNDGTFYTISVEAKSSRTWSSTNIQQRQKKMLFHAAVFAGLMAALMVALGFILTERLFQGILFTVIVITVGGFCLINFSSLNIHYWDNKVIDQVKRYPANEKWIALSADMYKRLKRQKREAHFIKMCQKKGIGLIRVIHSKYSVEILSPKAIPTPKNLESFLVCYARAEDIRRKMALVINETITISEPLLLDEPERSNVELDPAEIAESVSNAEAE